MLGQLLAPLRGRGAYPARLDVQFLPDALSEQRRSYLRVPATVPVAILGQPFGVAERDMWTVDVSAGGVLLGGLDAGGPGDRVRLRLVLPRGEPELAGRVIAGAAIVRVTAQGLRAARLEVLAAEDRERIAAYVAGRQRVLLEARREQGGRR